MSWRKEYEKYMDKVELKRKAFNKEMIQKLLWFLHDKYGSYRVHGGYVYLDFSKTSMTDFLAAIAPYITHNEIALVKGEIRISLRFC